MDDYPLSMRDLMALERIPELKELGVAGVVVGRGIKRPERLAKLTSVGVKCARDSRAPTPLEKDELELIFTGREFTDGYYPGGPGEDMLGVPGQPDRDAERAMHAIRKGYADSELRRVKVEFFALIQAGRPFRSGIQDEDGNRAVWNGPVPMEAFGQNFNQRYVESELRKTSGTPYSCEQVNVMLGPGVMLPEGVLQQARRELIRQLTAKRAQAPQVRIGRLVPAMGGSPEAAKLDTIFEVMSASQLTEELAELEPDFLYVPISVLAESPECIEPFLKGNTTVAAVLPRVIHDGQLRGMAELLQRARSAGVTQALVGSLGHVGIARAAGLDVRGDYGLNVFNSYTLQIVAKAGLLSATLSFELNMEQIGQLSKPLDTEIIAYGRLPAMLTERCLIKASAGRCACGVPARMSDEYGGVYPVVREYVCRNAVYGPSKVYLGDRLEDVKKAGVRGMRLLFTNEGARECVEVAKSYLGLNDYRPNGLTRGLYYRGV
jgi:putative protease